MEADWEVEVGGDAPVIDGCWDGLEDLRRNPEQAMSLPESKQLDGLAGALIQLNLAASPVWTSKCDVWCPEEFARDEMEASAEEGKCAIACYVDLLPRTHHQWPSLEEAVDVCRSLCARLREARLRCCRADLIVRGALLAPDRTALGITAYLTACGATLEDASAVLASALRRFVAAVGVAMAATRAGTGSDWGLFFTRNR